VVRVLALVGTLVVLGGCAEATEPGGLGSGIRGRVVAAPSCPVETAGSPCPHKGVQTQVNIESTDGERLFSVPTEPDGSFRAQVPPGDYLLSARPPPGDPTLVPRPSSVRVEPEVYAQVTLILDTRLREP
jgi:hypothetical protein